MNEKRAVMKRDPWILMATVVRFWSPFGCGMCAGAAILAALTGHVAMAAINTVAIGWNAWNWRTSGRALRVARGLQTIAFLAAEQERLLVERLTVDELADVYLRRGNR